MRVPIAYKFIAGFVMVIIAVIAVPHVFAKLQITGASGELGSVATAILVGLVIGSFFSRGTTKQFRRIREATERIAGGDLTKPVMLSRQVFVDETVEIADSINHMLKNLQELAGHLTSTVVEVSTMAQSLSSSAQEVNASTEEISSSMESVSKASGVQTDMVEKVNALIRNMVETVRSASESARLASGSSARARETAQPGCRLSMLATEKLRGVFEQVDESGRALYELGEKTRHVHKITDVITKIAQRTNLLALNATIEAARAGEYGRGFAVVAEEVRKLADNAARSAEQITTLLEEIDSESRQAVEKMRAGSAALDEGREDINTINRFLEEIQTGVTEVAARVEDITGWTERQAADADKLVANADEIAKAAEDNAAATQEVTAATQEQMASMEEMALSAQDLLKMAEKLETVACRFRVK